LAVPRPRAPPSLRRRSALAPPAVRRWTTSRDVGRRGRPLALGLASTAGRDASSDSSSSSDNLAPAAGRWSPVGGGGTDEPPLPTIASLLVVGDGDLSYSASVSPELASLGISLLATVLEDEATHSAVYAGSAGNAAAIRSAGHRAAFGVDATGQVQQQVQPRAPWGLPGERVRDAHGKGGGPRGPLRRAGGIELDVPSAVEGELDGRPARRGGRAAPGEGRALPRRRLQPLLAPGKGPAVRAREGPEDVRLRPAGGGDGAPGRAALLPPRAARGHPRRRRGGDMQPRPDPRGGRRAGHRPGCGAGRDKGGGARASDPEGRRQKRDERRQERGGRQWRRRRRERDDGQSGGLPRRVPRRAEARHAGRGRPVEGGGRGGGGPGRAAEGEPEGQAREQAVPVPRAPSRDQVQDERELAEGGGGVRQKARGRLNNIPNTTLRRMNLATNVIPVPPSLVN
ncbi:hypothetical protein THAOC_34763, partial [Thalassiosira oceanica]